MLLTILQAYLSIVFLITALFGLFKLAYCFNTGEFVPRSLCDRTTVSILKDVLKTDIFSIFLKLFFFIPKLIIINAYLFFAIIFVR